MMQSMRSSRHYGPPADRFDTQTLRCGSVVPLFGSKGTQMQDDELYDHHGAILNTSPAAGAAAAEYGLTHQEIAEHRD